MAKVLLVVASQPTIVPVGPAAAGLRFAVLDAASAVVATADEPAGVDQHEFDIDAPAGGDFTAVAARMNVDGSPVAGVPPLTKAFTIPSSTMTVDAPVGMTITVALGAGGALSIQ